ncbi:MAG: hypothetical protein SLAVMIC_00878 [uncultured marine phage]|uniref:Uncharacterized protein n=1 Tax=uncultured marine phage TaxID=707152 RepID=A0A8D9C9P0_9VIRU|nr:MAG: hypothetical protein SLAVMIC_00878 [uncultured marine phage]
MKEEELQKELDKLNLSEQKMKWAKDMLTHITENGEPYFHIDYIKRIIGIKDED